MKFNTQEEYGLRCLLRIAQFYEMEKTLTIPEISRGEGISEHVTAKILRALRLGGFIESALYPLIFGSLIFYCTNS
jgi:DNA-binding IscR family transcriptional regulator